MKIVLIHGQNHHAKKCFCLMRFAHNTEQADRGGGVSAAVCTYIFLRYNVLLCSMRFGVYRIFGGIGNPSLQKKLSRRHKICLSQIKGR